MKIVIMGELMDLNAFLKATKSHYLVGNRIKHEETERVYLEALKNKHRMPKITEYPIKIAYSWYNKDERKDIDNVAFAKKFINDGLVLAKIIPNDGRKYINGFTDQFYIDKENPRVEIEII